MLEMICTKCGETFIGDADDTEHIEREDSGECGGTGMIVREISLKVGR